VGDAVRPPAQTFLSHWRCRGWRSNLYIADAFDDCIREVSAATGIINTVAGNGTTGLQRRRRCGKPSAELHAPYGIALDGAGNLYIADNANSRIRKVSVATGIISTVVGNGTAGFTGDGGTATSAELYDPQGIAVDGAGNLYIGDTVNYVVRKVSAATGIITTLVGNGTGGTAATAERQPAPSCVLSAALR